MVAVIVSIIFWTPFGSAILFTQFFKIWFADKQALIAAVPFILICSFGTFGFVVSPYGAPKIKRLFGYLKGERKNGGCPA